MYHKTVTLSSTHIFEVLLRCNTNSNSVTPPSKRIEEEEEDDGLEEEKMKGKFNRSRRKEEKSVQKGESNDGERDT